VPELAELRQQIEDMALRLVVGDPESGAGISAWVSALDQIRDSATRERADGVAATAEAILKALRTDAPGTESAGSSAAKLQEGVARLQQALDAHLRGQETHLAQDPELMGDFILESREYLAGIETSVLTLERDPHDAEALHSVFRGFHTIKGLAGFLELREVQEVAHEVETVLDRARNSEWSITSSAADIILRSADYLRGWLAHLESTLQNQPSEAPRADDALLAAIRALVSGSTKSEIASETADRELAHLAAAVEASPAAETPAVPMVEANPAPETPAAAATPAPPRRNEAMAVKVDTAKLDYLVDMAGEMVIAESLVRHDPELASSKTPRLQRNLAQLTRITAELQKTAMAMRLVPIGPLFRRMARLVRDLSRQFGKNVEMETQGDEIQLDRTIVEELADPLMHMVRNALDHGVETADERQAKGKNPVARVLLKAQHLAGQVVIEVADDGRGLDREQIVAKATQKGLISSGDVLSDSEVYNLIFLPGFTTAAHLTNVSGRGVGMDVVRSHIEKLRGRIEIRSERGVGTTFLLKLPLTLAIIDGLVVGVGGERYIAPLFAVREMFRPDRDTLWTVQQHNEMALVRGTLLPVIRLYRRFRVTPRSEDPLQSVLVVAEVEGQRFGLLVDELIGKQEVVIKSLGESFKNVSSLAGGAILGDGRVGLILDLERLFRDKTGDQIR
jgi:two-component system chemotaxis sensor kinase CheA